MTDETVLFEGLGSAGTMAAIWTRYGDGDLRELLERLIADETGSVASRQSKEALEAHAAELMATGFEEAADIVLKYVASVPRERELMCPYSPEDRANYERWQEGYDRRQWMKQNPGHYAQTRPGN